MENQSPGNEIESNAAGSQKQGGSNTLTIILAAALILALAAIAFLLVFYVFGGDDDSGSEVAPPTQEVLPTPEEPADFPLIGTDWILAGTMEGTTISLVFSGDTLFGFAGCNSYNTTYRSTRAAGSTNNISVGSVSSTQVLCDEPVMNQEQSYLANLASASNYTISGETLTVTTGGGALTFGAAQVAPRPVE